MNDMEFEDFLGRPPFSMGRAEKEQALTERLAALTALHRDRCPAYRRMLEAVDYDPEKIGAKIRKAQMEKIPYMLIIGQKEADANNVSVRCRVRGDLGSMTLDEFIAQANKEVEEKTIVKAE